MDADLATLDVGDTECDELLDIENEINALQDDTLDESHGLIEDIGQDGVQSYTQEKTEEKEGKVSKKSAGVVRASLVQAPSGKGRKAQPNSAKTKLSGKGVTNDGKKEPASKKAPPIVPQLKKRQLKMDTLRKSGKGVTSGAQSKSGGKPSTTGMTALPGKPRSNAVSLELTCSTQPEDKPDVKPQPDNEPQPKNKSVAQDDGEVSLEIDGTDDMDSEDQPEATPAGKDAGMTPANDNEDEAEPEEDEEEPAASKGKASASLQVKRKIVAVGKNSGSAAQGPKKKKQRHSKAEVVPADADADKDSGDDAEGGNVDEEDDADKGVQDPGLEENDGTDNEGDMEQLEEAAAAKEKPSSAVKLAAKTKNAKDCKGGTKDNTDSTKDSKDGTKDSKDGKMGTVAAAGRGRKKLAVAPLKGADTNIGPDAGKKREGTVVAAVGKAKGQPAKDDAAKDSTPKGSKDGKAAHGRKKLAVVSKEAGAENEGAEKGQGANCTKGEEGSADATGSDPPAVSKAKHKDGKAAKDVKPGKLGQPVKAGKDGKDGKDGKVGEDGKDGKDCRDGKDGKDGKAVGGRSRKKLAITVTEADAETEDIDKQEDVAAGGKEDDAAVDDDENNDPEPDVVAQKPKVSKPGNARIAMAGRGKKKGVCVAMANKTPVARPSMQVGCRKPGDGEAGQVETAADDDDQDDDGEDKTDNMALLAAVADGDIDGGVDSTNDAGTAATTGNGHNGGVVDSDNDEADDDVDDRGDNDSDGDDDGDVGWKRNARDTIKQAEKQVVSKPKQPEVKPKVNRKLVVSMPVKGSVVEPKPSKPKLTGVMSAKPQKEAKLDAVPKMEGKKGVKEPKHGIKTAGFKQYLLEIRPTLPEGALSDIANIVGKMWKALPEEKKKEYIERGRAAEDESKGASNKPGSKDEKQKKPKQKRVKSSYLLFCEANRTAIKEANPEAPATEVMQLLGAAWGMASEAEKAKFSAIHEELKAAAAEGQDNVDIEKPARKKKAGKKEKAPADAEQIEQNQGGSTKAGKGSKKGGKKGSKQAAPKDEDENVEFQEEFESSESDREEVDWEENPAEMIFGITTDGKYLVKRKGLDFTEYGKLDSRVAKRQKLLPMEGQDGEGDEASTAACPVSWEMVNEFEAFTKQFWASVHEHTQGGDLDMDDLEQGSVLEMCYLLGKMQEPKHQLHRDAVKKGRGMHDIFIRVPALGLSMVVQRLLNSERQKCQAAQDLAETRLQQIQSLEEQLNGAENCDADDEDEGDDC